MIKIPYRRIDTTTPKGRWHFCSNCDAWPDGVEGEDFVQKVEIPEGEEQCDRCITLIRKNSCEKHYPVRKNLKSHVHRWHYCEYCHLWPKSDFISKEATVNIPPNGERCNFCRKLANKGPRCN